MNIVCTYFRSLVVKSFCDLERIEAILSDCDGSVTSTTVSNYGSYTVVEALIVTFEHVKTTAPVSSSIVCLPIKSEFLHQVFMLNVATLNLLA